MNGRPREQHPPSNHARMHRRLFCEAALHSSAFCFCFPLSPPTCTGYSMIKESQMNERIFRAASHHPPMCTGYSMIKESQIKRASVSSLSRHPPNVSAPYTPPCACVSCALFRYAANVYRVLYDQRVTKTRNLISKRMQYASSSAEYDVCSRAKMECLCDEALMTHGKGGGFYV